MVVVKPASLCLVLALLLMGSLGHDAAAQQPLELDFERAGVSGTGLPWGWTFGWSAFAGGAQASFSLDSTVARSGQRSLHVALADTVAASVAIDAAPQMIMLMIPAGFAHGGRLRLHGWVRAGQLDGSAVVALEAWRDRAFAAADTVRLQPAANGEWLPFELNIHVADDESVHSIVVSSGLEGRGSVWFDAFELYSDDERVTSLPDIAPAPSSAELGWLRSRAEALRTVEPNASEQGDLRLFDDVVGAARVVALGESTHGTREFFQVKHRLLEHLVERRGFRVFGIEANQVAVERIDRYVRGGPGTAREVMRAMFAVWNTEEMHALVEWMREYNAAHPSAQVRFVGYDMQDHRTPADSLSAFLAELEPDLLPLLEPLAQYRAERNYATPHIADSTRARWRSHAETLWRRVDEQQGAWLQNAFSELERGRVQRAVQYANLLRQAATLNETLNSPDRDSMMAANLEWTLRTVEPDARAVVWAHDIHVSRGGDPERSFNAGEQMGAYLARWLEDDYRAFSLLTYEGTYRATRSFTDHEMIVAEAFPGPTGSLEAALHDLDPPPDAVGWILDLRAPLSAAGDWLQLPRPIRHVGYAAYDYGFELTAVLPLEFDGVVFIDRSEASRPVR